MRQEADDGMYLRESATDMSTGIGSSKREIATPASTNLQSRLAASLLVLELVPHRSVRVVEQVGPALASIVRDIRAVAYDAEAYDRVVAVPPRVGVRVMEHLMTHEGDRVPGSRAQADTACVHHLSGWIRSLPPKEGAREPDVLHPAVVFGEQHPVEGNPLWRLRQG